jgi:eukaryotic-like serine/threonine-protein kinase
MTISRGSRLGPYEVASPLGAGGMGEVFRAWDTRLSREVAIKVLPAEVAADPTRLKRFEKEARSASSLNHPSIVTIYEIGQADSVSYIAMELVEGKTLREGLCAGALPMRRLLQIGAQVADGLAKAHASGIVHRDLKPENIMVSGDGFAKILDFGLAKLTQNEPESGGHTKAETVSAGTEPGVVMGTVGYMSPEQAVGQALDFRSDQFSFGSVLYEMATGKRAFSGKTKPETLAAIIREEPEAIGTLNPKVPPPLRWIIERCLAKDPEDRYASTRDLARDLATLRDRRGESSSGESAISAPSTTSRRRLAMLLAAGALMAFGLIAGRWLWRSAGPSVPHMRRITFRHGVTGPARFAPDGQTIVYSAAWDGRPWELFSGRAGSPEWRSLGLPPANILSISSTGEMAIQLLAQDTLARVPLAGGAPREILENVAEADWAPGGKDLAVIHRLGNGLRLEWPIGKVLVESPNILHSLHFSPKGDRIAYLESRPDMHASSVNVVDRSGRKAVLATGLDGGDLAWAPKGEEIWVTSNERLEGSTELRAVNLAGRIRSVFRFSDTIRLYDVASDGRLLVEHVLVRGEIRGFPAAETRQIPLSWLDGSEASDLSADGKRLLINEWTRGAVYLRGTDGSPAVRLGEGSAQALSPDGNWALASLASPPRLALLPTGPGKSREYPLGELRIGRTGAAAFFPDGSRVVVMGQEPGRERRSYLLDLGTGTLRPITPPGIAGRWVSPDGRLLLARGADAKFTLYPVEANAGVPARPVPGLVPEDVPIRWSDDGRFLFVMQGKDLTASVFRVEVSTGERKPLREFQPTDPAGVLGAGQVLVTPDARFWVCGYWRDLSDLYLVDGLK